MTLDWCRFNARLTRRLWRVAVEALVGIDFSRAYDIALKWGAESQRITS